jgi:RimJ/RimL family protein N-acetyltransferase
VAMKTPKVLVTPLTAGDFSEIERLSISTDQQGFVISPSDFLKRSNRTSFQDRHKLFFTIKQVKRRAVVGLLILDKDSINPDSICWLSAIMIDKQRQGRGYARATLDLLLNQKGSPLREYFPHQERIMLSVNVYNRRAIRIYLDFGFREILRSESRIVFFRDL